MVLGFVEEKKKKGKEKRAEKEKAGKKTARAAGETRADWPAAMELALLFFESPIHRLPLALSALPTPISSSRRPRTACTFINSILLSLHSLSTFGTPALRLRYTPPTTSNRITPASIHPHLFFRVQYRTLSPLYVVDQLVQIIVWRALSSFQAPCCPG